MEVIHWLRKQPLAAGQHQLVNGVSDENLTFNSYGAVLQELNRFEKKPLTVSEPLLRLGNLDDETFGLGVGIRFEIPPGTPGQADPRQRCEGHGADRCRLSLRLAAPAFPG